MMNNSFNESGILRPNALHDSLVVTVWSIMLIYGLVANVLVLAGIYRSTSMRSATSYWLIVSLAICDIFMILISLVHLVPATALHDKFVVVNSARNVWALFSYNTVWYMGVLTLGLMAVNRFVSIVYPTAYPSVFSKERTKYYIAALFGLGLVVSLPTLFPCCHVVWDHNYYVSTYNPLDTNYFIVDILVNSVSVISMIICYAVILMRVRQSRQALAKYRSTMKRMSNNDSMPNVADCQTTRYAAIPTPPRESVSKREMRLFLQFFIVSMIFLGTWVTWQWLPRISASKWIFFAMTSFFFINNAVNPTVYFIFNTTLRREVRSIFLELRKLLFNESYTVPGTGEGSKPSSTEQPTTTNNPNPIQRYIGSPRLSLKRFANEKFLAGKTSQARRCNGLATKTQVTFMGDTLLDARQIRKISEALNSQNASTPSESSSDDQKVLINTDCVTNQPIVITNKTEIAEVCKNEVFETGCKETEPEQESNNVCDVQRCEHVTFSELDHKLEEAIEAGEVTMVISTV